MRTATFINGSISPGIKAFKNSEEIIIGRHNGEREKSEIKIPIWKKNPPKISSNHIYSAGVETKRKRESEDGKKRVHYISGNGKGLRIEHGMEKIPNTRFDNRFLVRITAPTFKVISGRPLVIAESDAEHILVLSPGNRISIPNGSSGEAIISCAVKKLKLN